MDGGSYYKSLRAHFLIDAALYSCFLDKELADDKLRYLKSYINKCVTEKLGVNYRNKAVEDLSQKMLEKLQKTSSNSRTPALWLTYHKLITLVKDFIRAERLHDFNLHLATNVANICGCR